MQVGLWVSIPVMETNDQVVLFIKVIILFQRQNNSDEFWCTDKYSETQLADLKYPPGK